MLLDSRFNWDIVQGEIVDVYYHGPVSRRAKNVLEACDKSVKDISELKGLFPFMMGWSPDDWLVEDVNKKEGDVSIDKMPKKNKPKSDKLGDYVDYEEID